jgi:hypothetical protein
MTVTRNNLRKKNAEALVFVEKAKRLGAKRDKLIRCCEQKLQLITSRNTSRSSNQHRSMIWMWEAIKCIGFYPK